MGNGIKPTVYSHFTLGDMAAYYMLEKEDSQIELILSPSSKRKRINMKNLMQCSTASVCTETA